MSDLGRMGPATGESGAGKPITLREAMKAWSLIQWAEWFLGLGLQIPNALKTRLLLQGTLPQLLTRPAKGREN